MAAAVQNFYRYHSLIYDWTRWTILHGRKRAVEMLNLRPNSSVLEIGCGTGLNFRFLQNKLDPAAGRLVGLDFSADMLRVAAKRVAAKKWANVELVEADASNMNLNRKFDAVFFAYSLTMIPDWHAAIKCARRHLNPGGRLVVLDFGQFKAWGPMGPVMRGWLRWNHVETLRRYIDALNDAFPDLEVFHWLGDYCYTAVGVEGADK